MKDRSFIITVDTEGDNLWTNSSSLDVSTENARFIPRFQEMCEKYGFKPVYLTNYEMALNDEWVRYSAQKAREGKCEIGLHIHAWNTPPIVELEKKFNGNPYITEYTAEQIEEKVKTVLDLLRERYETPIISHRSGRWATNDTYFEILARHGIKIDCSFTPEIDLSILPGCTVAGGNDYRDVCKHTHRLKSGIIEVPMTTRKLYMATSSSVKHNIKTLLLGEPTWLRPITKSENVLKCLTRKVQKEKDHDCLEFMLHSSELMPGGSPYFKNEADIECLYDVLEAYFSYVNNLGYKGYTLSEYVNTLDV